MKYAAYVTAVLPIATALWYFGQGGDAEHTYWLGHWWFKWACLLTLMIPALAWHAGRALHWSVGLVTLSVLLSSFRVLFWLADDYQNFPKDFNVAISYACAVATISYLLFVAFFAALTKPALRALYTGFILTHVLVCAHMLYQRFWLGHSGEAVAAWLGNASMAGCYVAVSFFLFVQARLHVPTVTLPAFALTCAAVLATGRTMPVLVLLAGSCASVLSWGAPPRKILYVVAGGAACFVTACAAYPDFVHFSGRYDVWTASLDYFFKHTNLWLGAGPGVTIELYPSIQIMNDYRSGTKDLFMWLHNDWLQTFFEQGFLGAAAIACLFVALLARTYGTRGLFGAVMAYAVMAAGNYPAHMPLHALLGGFLVAYAFKDGGKHGHAEDSC